jgi:hypothetical protein
MNNYHDEIRYILYFYILLKFIIIINNNIKEFFCNFIVYIIKLNKI